MTEYTSSPEAIQVWSSARERTAHWIKRQNGDDFDLLSPSVPPSILSDEDALSYGPSDSESSSSSIPPRMLLHYTDGRPDIPISRDARHIRSRSYSQSHAQPRGFIPPEADYAMSSSRSGRFGAPSHHPPVPSAPSRHAQTLSYASGPFLGPPHQAHITPPASPEHIVVLPSPQGEDPPNASHTAAAGVPSHHSQPIRSRAATLTSVHHPQPLPAGSGGYPSNRSQQPTLHAPSPRHAFNPSHISRQAAQSPQLAYSQSDPLPSGSARYAEHTSRPDSRLPYAYAPPAIVYAPSSRHPGPRYAPPAIVYSPSAHAHQGPARGAAPSIAYSQSDPLPHGHTPRYAPGPPPSSRGVTPHADPRGSTRSRGHARSHSVNPGHRRVRIQGQSQSSSRSPTPPLSDAGSQTSGSTYYVLPTPGQKVQIIVSPPVSRHCPSDLDQPRPPFYSNLARRPVRL